MAGDSAIGEEVGRIGEDYVNAFLGHGGKDLQAIALKNLDVVFGVFECGFERDEAVFVARAGRTGFRAVGMRLGRGHRDSSIGIVDRGVKEVKLRGRGRDSGGMRIEEGKFRAKSASLSAQADKDAAPGKGEILRAS